MIFWINIEKIFLEFMWTQNRPQIVKAISKNYNAGLIVILHFKNYYRAIIIKTDTTGTEADI